MDARDGGMSTNRAILIFIGITYASSIALGLLIGVTGGFESALIQLRFLSMLIPALAVLVVRSLTNERSQLEWNRLPLKYVPLALLLMPVVMHAAMLPVTAAYEGRLPWEDWLARQPDGLYHSPAQRGWGALTLGGLVRRIGLNAVVGVTIASVLAFFEEVGWRAWLLPRLAERGGARSAVVITSIIWAVWHVPFQLSGIQHIDGVSPVHLALTLPFGIFATGLVLGWFWVKTESIWIVTLAHGALNSWSQYAFKYMTFVRAPDSVVGAAGGLAVLVLGALLLTGGFTAPRSTSHTVNRS
jgi:membrane protease YdiL (CAAX protease family)